MGKTNHLHVDNDLQYQITATAITRRLMALKVAQMVAASLQERQAPANKVDGYVL